MLLVGLLKDLKYLQIEYKKNDFSMNHFGQFIFVGCYFLKFLDGIKEKAPKHQTRQHIIFS